MPLRVTWLVRLVRVRGTLVTWADALREGPRGCVTEMVMQVVRTIRAAKLGRIPWRCIIGCGFFESVRCVLYQYFFFVAFCNVVPLCSEYFPMRMSHL